MTKKNPLVLIGYKGSGKTFFGSLLAQELGIPFVDTDRSIEALYKDEFRELLDCRGIFNKIGAQKFRELEEQAIVNIKEIPNVVVAVGGGAVLHPKNQVLLKTHGTLAYLEADKETIRKRMFENGIPSFLDSKDPNTSFEKMYEERKPIYERLASFKITLHGKTDRQVLDELLNAGRSSER